jgi:FkbM family methyltransferase
VRSFDGTIGKPTWALKALSWGVKAGVITLGRDWVLRNLPEALWGGANIEASTDVGPVVVPLRDPGSSGLLLRGCVPHEIRETALVRALARECRVVLDVGAHVGWYSRLAWEQMPAGRQVHAFEPNPVIFPYLEENARNRDGLCPRQIAIGEREGLVTFYCAESSNLCSAVRPVGAPIDVSATTLDAVGTSLDVIGRVDFIKCDVEGGELAVLRGARRLRDVAEPPVLMIEVDPSFLGDAGVSADDLNNEIQKWGGPSTCFYLDHTGKPIEIADVNGSAGVPNVFVVPQAWLARFLKAAELARP